MDEFLFVYVSIDHNLYICRGVEIHQQLMDEFLFVDASCVHRIYIKIKQLIPAIRCTS